MNWKTCLASVVLLCLPHLVMASPGLAVLDNVFDSPVQAWRGAENGTLALGGSTHIYGFKSADIGSNGRIAVAVKGIVDNDSWKTFCHLGYPENSSSGNGYLCQPSVGQILQVDVMPTFDVTFDDVRDMVISNSSTVDRTFNNVSGDLNLQPGNYRNITLQTTQRVTFRPGNYNIQKLELADGTQLYLPAGSSLSINTLITSPWNGKRISITSDTQALKIKNVTVRDTDVVLNSGIYQFEAFTTTGNSSTLNVYDASFSAYSLSFSNGSAVNFHVGRDKSNFKVYEYMMSGGANRAYFAAGVYYIKRYLNTSSKNETMYDGAVTLVANKVNLNGSGKGQGKKVNLYALDDRFDPSSAGQADFNVDGSANLCANVFSRRRFSVSGAGVFTGAVIADQTILSGSASIRYYPGAACSASDITTQTDYQLQVIPELDYSLICTTQDIHFQVATEGEATGSYRGKIAVTPDNNLTLVAGKGTKLAAGLYQANAAGELWFQLSSAGRSNLVNVSATLLDSDGQPSVSGEYHFVPYKLAAEDQRVIASKPQPVTITAQTCTADGSPKDLAYQGTPTISSEWQAPANGVGELKFSPVFKDGEATADLVMDDSGIKTVLLEDSNFNCRELGDDCPIKGKGTLQGSFTVYSRPWTLAICSPGDSSAMDGNITDRNSTAFTAAGNTFGLNVRPLRWISGGAAQGEIETSGLCARPVTQNFFSSAAQLSAKAELSYRVAEPEDGANGTLNGELQRYNTSGVNDEYLPFSDLNWSEVGVLRVQAGLSDEYLGMTVNPGYREIGRFYPAWLSLSANDWDYPDGQTGFAYMNQPFGYGFSVEAQNSQGQVTQNYSSFDPALIADIKLLAVDSSGGDLGARIADYDLQFWDGSGSWSDGVLSGEHSLTFSKRVTNPSPYTTSADGPFTSGFGLRVTDKVDGVDFTSPQLTLTQDGTTVDRGAVFGSQPDIRYGRMVLDDVGGTTVSKINVPLRTEYWQGSRFVTNRDDNGSWFRSSANSVCRQSIWTADADKFNSSLEPRQASLQIPTVAAGESDQLMATPHSEQEQNSVREQVRFWLRLDDSSSRSPQLADSSITCGPQGADNPWLQYNWRGVGDEDPSAVVTFGVHRGNDRVIFRGEARLTGQ
ncbi:DUF6701 domain-containing protein [Vibrio sp. H11]|uniref:DUF6701 domain-containing protein n=1 Tax=Vibrio sp. H11 TaxID=2565928 RepID=UPI0010A6105A|nr:DUF6701 domain-containing protein [Vibrio sp. H11]